MNYIETLLEEYGLVQVVLIIILVFVAVEWLVSKWHVIVSWLNVYHEHKSAEENEENRFVALEESTARIQSCLAEMYELMEKLDTNNKRTTIASSRSTIYRVCNESMERGYMTQVEFEIIDELGDIYVSLGGNHYVKDRLLPTTLGLPVMSPDGTMYKATPKNIELRSEAINDRENQEVINS